MFGRLKSFLVKRKEDIQYVGGSLAVVLLYQQFVGQLTLCIGPSMEPTFDTNGETAYVYKFPYWFGKKFEKGNVIVAVCPTDPQKRVCKRVAAVENEVVLEERSPGSFVLIQVPPGHCYLRGDNPSNSTDSRSYGPVPENQIIGRITWKFSYKNRRFERLSQRAPAPDYVVTTLEKLHDNLYFRKVAGLPVNDVENPEGISDNAAFDLTIASRKMDPDSGLPAANEKREE